MAQAKRGKAATPADEQTRRVVLERVRVVVIPPELDGVPQDEMVDRLRPLIAEPDDAWIERGEFAGSKTRAIEAYAGKPGTAGARLGEFKAPPARSWQGGVRHSAPPEPKVEREILL